MRFSRLSLLLLVLLFLVGVTSQASRIAPDFIANRERVQALRVLVNSIQGDSMDEWAWDAGWRSLCNSNIQTPPSATSQEALSFIAHTKMEQGDYAGALAEFRRIVAEGDAGDVELARAYVAALEMRWLDAARLYPSEPTPRHQRYWATVFYLAAQQLMFSGQADKAAEWYRKADAGYGTQGPYLGLSLVDCLAQQGRTLEAFDAYRRALVVLRPDEALAQRERFEQMRLAALRLWQEQDPANAQAAGWLEFYANDRPVEETETLAETPLPQVALLHDLGDGHRLVGFDYRPEDIETGPFMWVDLYVQQGPADGDPVVRLRRAVLNQAPNGSFAWDAAPDGVRPFGWHGNLYSADFRGIGYSEITGQERWLCMDGGIVQEAIGLESLAVSVTPTSDWYLQGGKGIYSGDRSPAIGRTWFKDGDGVYPYSYVGGVFPAGHSYSIQGLWKPGEGLDQVAVWLFSHATSKACFQENFLLALPSG